MARLYAGDVYSRKGDVAAAAEWFGKAIAIDPDTETAYRYWADTISKSGDEEGALAYYIRAVVAEPYERLPRAALQNWAQRNHVKIHVPQVPRPDVTMKDDGKGKGPHPVINVDPESCRTKQRSESGCFTPPIAPDGWRESF